MTETRSRGWRGFVFGAAVGAARTAAGALLLVRDKGDMVSVCLSVSLFEFRPGIGGAFAPPPPAQRGSTGERERMMRLFKAVAGAAALHLAVFAGMDARADGHGGTISEAQLKADVGFLADDLLEGREAGTRGFTLAAHYVAQRMTAMGLKPGGIGGGYMQPVTLVSYGLDRTGKNALSFGGAASDLQLNLGADFVVTASPMADAALAEGRLVFTGFGFSSEKYGRDDFAGVDLTGKIAVMLLGMPPIANMNSEERAHLRSQAVAEASKRGAIGTIFLNAPTLPGSFPFKRYAFFILGGGSRMGWAGADGTVQSNAPNVKASAIVDGDAASRLMAAAGRSLEDVVAAALSPGGTAPFDMGVTARIEAASQRRFVTSPNVIGIVEGRDAALKDEYVVVSAHLDHVGMRPSVQANTDQIFNGAMDNSVGVAATLEAARVIAAAPPRRSVVFVTVTAEEKGLIGADYFAHYPTVDKTALVAAVNLDMPIMTYEFSDLIAFGAERSTLFGAVQKAVDEAGLALIPDPMPEQGLFTRSDHYRFVQQGIPSAFLMPGFGNGGEAAWRFFLQTHYHKATDEVSLVRFDQLARFASLKANIIRNIADMDDRPLWNAGDFFGKAFDGPMAPEGSEPAMTVAFEEADTAPGDGVVFPGEPLCGSWAYPCLQ